MTSGMNIDHEDLLEASGAYPRGFDHAEYQQWLDSMEERAAEEAYWAKRYEEMILDRAAEGVWN